MEQVLLLNASPRSTESSSAIYLSHLETALKKQEVSCSSVTLSSDNHHELGDQLFHSDKVVMAFPLYADCIPSTLLSFWNYIEQQASEYNTRPKIYVVINCGYLEHTDNDIAISIVKQFCIQVGFEYGFALKIGSGEMIMTIPFKFMVIAKLKKMSKLICSEASTEDLYVQMPLGKKMFVKKE